MNVVGVMNVVGSFEAKSKLSELLAKAEQGEETVITRRHPATMWKRPATRCVVFELWRSR